MAEGVSDQNGVSVLKLYIKSKSVLNQNEKFRFSQFIFPEDACAVFLREAASLLKWGDLSDSSLLDFGSKVHTISVVTAVFPNYKNITFLEFPYINVSSFAKKLILSDIKRWDKIVSWRKTFQKVVSFFPFNQLNDPLSVFEFLHYMMRPGGEAIILTSIKNDAYRCTKDMFQKQKWKHFRMYQNNLIGTHEEGLEFYENVLKEVGFEIIQLKEKTIQFIFEDKEKFREFALFDVKLVTDYLPPNLRKDFEEEYCQTMSEMLGCLETGEYYQNLISLPIIVKVPELVPYRNSTNI